MIAAFAVTLAASRADTSASRAMLAGIWASVMPSSTSALALPSRAVRTALSVGTFRSEPGLSMLVTGVSANAWGTFSISEKSRFVMVEASWVWLPRATSPEPVPKFLLNAVFLLNAGS